MAAAPAAPWPAGGGAVSGQAPDGGGPRRARLGPAGLGRPLSRGRSRFALLGARSDGGRQGGSGRGAPGRAGSGGRVHARGPAAGGRRAGAEGRAAGRGGPGPPSRRRGVPGRCRAGAGARGDSDRGPLVRRPGPSAGAGTGDRDRELLAALEGNAEGRTYGEIAAAVWGPDRAEEEYFVGGWMHSRIARWLRKARTDANRYRDLARGAGDASGP